MSVPVDQMGMDFATDLQGLDGAGPNGLYRTIVEATNEGIWVVDADGLTTYVNPGLAEMLGWRADEIVGRPLSDFVEDGARPAIQRRLRWLRSRSGERHELLLRRRDGRPLWAVLSTAPLPGEDGEQRGMLAIVADITESRQATAHRERAESRLAQAEALAHIGSWEWDIRGDRIVWSDELYRIFGVEPAAFDASYEAYLEHLHPEDRGTVDATVRRALEDHSPFAFEHRIVRPDGSMRMLLGRGEVVVDDTDQPVRMIGTAQDITERKEAEEQLRYQALHDPLTGLPNRTLFRDHLGMALARANRKAKPAAVLFLDLDQFKVVNDSLGHSVGDQLLRSVGERLRQAVRAGDTVARLGGDEFVVLAEDLDDEAEALAIAERIRMTLARPFRISDEEIYSSTSIGIAFSDHYSTPESLLRDADVAMYRAKSAGPGHQELFDDAMRREVLWRLRTETELRRAIPEHEFRLVYQPLVSLATDEPTTVGCEALLRWAHPEHGLLAPDRFVRIAEENELIVPIGEWVLDQACRQARAWRKEGKDISVSVNISPRQLAQPEFVGQVERTLKRAGLSAPYLCMEITELAVVDNPTNTAASLHGLRDLGVRIAIDDFGKGQSSLAYLKALPVDVVKVDRTFVEGVATNKQDRAILAAVLSLAEVLGMSVIAEGVENEAQVVALQRLGCPLAQGFHFARPVPSGQLSLEDSFTVARPGYGDPLVIREFMRQIGIPARIEP